MTAGERCCPEPDATSLAFDPRHPSMRQQRTDGHRRSSSDRSRHPHRHVGWKGLSPVWNC